MKYIKNIYWRLKSLLAAVVNGFASKKLILIGVTGTDGKTSTTLLIHHVLESLGEKAAYVSTLGAKIGKKKYSTGFHVTTPRFFMLHRLFRQAVKNKNKYFVLEVTSHAISQKRVCDCLFKVAVLTNITNEHLDYYKNYEEYAKTKVNFVNRAEVAVVNSQCPFFYRYKKLLANKNIWYTSLNKKTDTSFNDLIKLGLSSDFTHFQKKKIVLAYTTALVLGFKKEEIIGAINHFKGVKGRFEFISKQDRTFLVDFAHTPNAFTQLYHSIEKNKYSNIIHVFGCAGLRDSKKRAKMGQIVAQNASIIILTEEDYRTESLELINKQIQQGIKKVGRHHQNKNLFIANNRQEAINLAVKTADKNSLIVLSGKAHEKSLARGLKECPWDEYTAIDKALAENINDHL